MKLELEQVPPPDRVTAELLPALKVLYAATTKVLAFERDLEAALRGGQVRNERDVIQICFRHGVKRQHASSVLSKLKTEGVIDIAFRVPDIRRLRQPRLVRAER